MKKFYTLLTTATLSLAMAMTAAAAGNSIEINGAKLNAQTITVGEVEMVPVRAVATELGMEVNWDGENKSVSLAKMPAYITFTIGTDGYTFAKTAPQPLGAAPVIVDGNAYVPTALFSELMSLEVSDNNGTLSITAPTDTATSEAAVEVENSSSVTVVEICDNDITVEDKELGEVALVANEATVITDSEGNTAALADIKVGDSLEVVYGEAMTMSLPPINNPVSITIK